MKLKSMLLSAGALLVLSAHAGLENLTGQFRNGQLFLQWKESNLAPDTRLSVWSSDAPITKENLGKAVKVASMLNLQSARDWWLNADNFVIKRSKKAKGEEIFAGNVADTGAKKNTEKGFVISDGGKSISPDGGLHVHTPWKEVTGKRYYAVAAHKGASEKVIDLVATTAPIKVTVGKSAPIRIKGNLKRNSAKGLPLIISLHGRGGGVGVDKKGNPVGTHIIYSDRNFAWREGIPFKFSAGIRRDKVLTISLNDRVWIGRKLNKKESTDSRDYIPPSRLSGWVTTSTSPTATRVRNSSGITTQSAISCTSSSGHRSISEPTSTAPTSPAAAWADQEQFRWSLTFPKCLPPDVPRFPSTHTDGKFLVRKVAGQHGA